MQVLTLKSCGLWCGSWKHRRDKPLNIGWNNEGNTFLGVYLGNKACFEDKNWENIIEEVENVLKRWKHIVKCLSY